MKICCFFSFHFDLIILNFVFLQKVTVSIDIQRHRCSIFHRHECHAISMNRRHRNVYRCCQETIASFIKLIWTTAIKNSFRFGTFLAIFSIVNTNDTALNNHLCHAFCCRLCSYFSHP